MCDHLMLQPLPSLQGEHCAQCGRPLDDDVVEVRQDDGSAAMVCPECAAAIAPTQVVVQPANYAVAS